MGHNYNGYTIITGSLDTVPKSPREKFAFDGRSPPRDIISCAAPPSSASCPCIREHIISREHIVWSIREHILWSRVPLLSPVSCPVSCPVSFYCGSSAIMLSKIIYACRCIYAYICMQHPILHVHVRVHEAAM
jgi:hypothetical protein